MQELKERIRREGKVLPGNIIKVDGFLNHRVDVKLMEDIAGEFEKHFDTSAVTMVLTAEASGIALATICAQKYADCIRAKSSLTPTKRRSRKFSARSG